MFDTLVANQLKAKETSDKSRLLDYIDKVQSHRLWQAREVIQSMLDRGGTGIFATGVFDKKMWYLGKEERSL